MDAESLASITELYQAAFTYLVPVSTMEVAEMTKLYENCQRMVSIAYANEMADACMSHRIDPLEVCKAAASKPFGYQPYSPSLGVGGHCIPVNPFYLLSNNSWPCLEMATKKMASRPADIGDRIMAEMATTCLPGPRPRILVVGVSFKKGQSVLSNAPGIGLIVHLLSTYDVYVEFADPLVDEAQLSYVPKLQHTTEWNVEGIERSFDAVVVAIAQDGLDLDILQQLRRPKVFNFTSALPWSCPSLRSEAESHRYESRMPSLSSVASTPEDEEMPSTPNEPVALQPLDGAIYTNGGKIAETVATLEKAMLKVLVAETGPDAYNHSSLHLNPAA